jgi:hypothetical protein
MKRMIGMKVEDEGMRPFAFASRWKAPDFQFSTDMSGKGSANIDEMNSVSLEMNPISVEINSISMEMNSISREMNPISVEMKIISREMKPVSMEMKIILREMETVSREMVFISSIDFSASRPAILNANILTN